MRGTRPPDGNDVKISPPTDYQERVYAGWLGKCIGVRFGAPVENWTYQEIRDNLGPLEGYLAEPAGKIFKPDDDTSFPMILVRALEEVGHLDELTAQTFADTWLNDLGDHAGTLWWGGYGISTEHTAYDNLAHGIPAPRSGSSRQNGTMLAEQIGGQIFSDIWGLVFPNDPARSAIVAELASSVSHDGNGILGGRFIAAMVSHAFVETDPLGLIDAGLEQIPKESEYARVVRSVVAFHQQHPDDWHACYRFLDENFGYRHYPGEVPIIPNAGVVVMALAYGAGDFTRTLQVANMAGWDTDCNVGNVGTIMGVASGLAGIAPQWREPMNDLLITASLIGVRNALTIPQCADLICAQGRRFARQASREKPQQASRDKSRIHFHYSGSTNNVHTRGIGGRIIDLRQVGEVAGRPALSATIRKLGKKGEVRIYTRTHYHTDELSSNYYGASFSPLIYPGQTVTAQLYLPVEAPDSIRAALYSYDEHHQRSHQARSLPLRPGNWHDLSFAIPELRNAALAEVGVVIRNTSEHLWSTGAFYLASLDWGGTPSYSSDFTRERADAGGISQWTRLRGYWRLQDGAYHGSGVGLCESYSGDIDWQDYTFEVRLVPLMGDHHNINVRVQGAQRSYALGLAPEGTLGLYKKASGTYHLLASQDFPWRPGVSYTLGLTACGRSLTARARAEDHACTLRWEDVEKPYLTGQIGLSSWYGSHTRFTEVRVGPDS